MKQLKMLLLSSLVMLFTACGGGSSTSTELPVDLQAEAISKITLYADDPTQPVPTVEDYADAGVEGVTLENIDDVNSVVASLTSSDVDTVEEIQQVVNDLGINILPTANAGVDKTVVINQAVTITGSGTDTDGTIVSYEWKKGDIVLAATAAFTYTPTVVGTDTLTLTVMDDDGAIASDSMNVIVTEATAVTTVSFASDVMPIFVDADKGDCARCHTTSSKKTFKVGDAAYTYNNITTNSLINTVSPDSSLILLKGNDPIGHTGGDALSDVNSATIRTWIVEGGLNN